MTVPAVGDIWMLSQTAWRIERAFAAGQKDAPPDFQVIEAESGDLAKALKLLAEALHADEETNTLRNAAASIRTGISTIVASCQRTINDLDSLISQYQIIRKHRTSGGFAIEVSWSDLVLDDYPTMMWTSEGGDLQDLKHLLHLHTSSITLTTQAVQSNSLYHLDSVINPLADRFYRMHHSSQTVSVQVGEVQALVQDLAMIDPTTQAPPIPPRNPARSPVAEQSNSLGPQSNSSNASSLPFGRHYSGYFAPRSHQRSQSAIAETPTTPPRTFTKTGPISPSESMSTSRASMHARNRISEFSSGASPLRYSNSSYATSDTGTSLAGWPSPESTQDRPHKPHRASSLKKAAPLPQTPQRTSPGQRVDNKPLPLLPAPDLAPSTPCKPEQNTAPASRSIFNFYPSSHPNLMKLHPNTSQNGDFEQEAFRNSAILCDVRANRVEYSHQLGEDDKHGVEMLTASEECRIAVVRKRIPIAENRQVRVVTSIWTLSDDGLVRMELRMADDQMYIPYSSYFSLSKVSITVPCKLKFHDVQLGSRPLKTVRTSWVNYIFDSSEASALFQNELMGRTLLTTLRTERTMRIHEGIGGHFAYAEQLCALENLRIWKDSHTGAIIALIHFSASFRSGYLAFYINSSVNPIKVKDDGAREVKIKGLRVPIHRREDTVHTDGTVTNSDMVNERDKSKDRTDDSKRKMEKGKIISGAKIEFRTQNEKREFLDLCNEMQRNLIELPDLLGVN